MVNHSKERTEAEAQFKQIQKTQPDARPISERAQATAEYLAAGHAAREKTAQLKELRLAKKATGNKAEIETDHKKKKRRT